MNPKAIPDQARFEAGIVPLVIAVTGHRDLVPGEVPRITEIVRGFFLGLRERFPDRPLQLLSPLAEGADRLAAEVALELGCMLTVPLPMERDDYFRDFVTEGSRRDFDRLCARADELFELPVAAASARPGLQPVGNARDIQYAQLGAFICAHCHVLLALWDGKPAEEIGGTAQVVRFHRDDVMTGFDSTEEIQRQLLVDDDSDLIFHVAVSRNRPNGGVADGLEPMKGSP